MRRGRGRTLTPSPVALVLALAGLVAASSSALGCKPGGDEPRPAPSRPAPSPAKCTRVGQTCEFAPNKLGSCVQRDDCTEDCLVCQSQH